MKKLVVAVALLAAGGWFFQQKFRIEGWQAVKLVPRDGTFAGLEAQDVQRTGPPVQRDGESIRLGSFHVQVLGNSKLDKTHVRDWLARIVRRFDVIAIQGIRSADQDVLPRLVEAVNATGAHYDFVVGPRLPRQLRLDAPGETFQEQYAFLFDRASVEIDRLQLYTVDDPDDLLRREPLVAWFRVRGPGEEQAFTFTMVNYRAEREFARDELLSLDDVFLAVQNDGRQEDDVILVGDFQCDDSALAQLDKIPGLQWVIAGTPTNTMATDQTDNLLFSRLATAEYLGRGGVFDFLREYNLSEEQALEVSHHLPVWAEFSIYEGGKPGAVAERPSAVPR